MFENNQIDTTHLPKSEDIDFTKHPKRYRTHRFISLIILAMLSCFAWISLLFAGETNSALIVLGGWSLFVIFLFVAEIKSFKNRGYAIREHDITYRKGWIFTSQTTIPFNRIQHTEISQGPIERSFNLKTLKIYTAGGSSSDLRIGGLEPENAASMKEFIAIESGKND